MFKLELGKVEKSYRKRGQLEILISPGVAGEGKGQNDLNSIRSHLLVD